MRQFYEERMSNAKCRQITKVRKIVCSSILHFEIQHGLSFTPFAAFSFCQIFQDTDVEILNWCHWMTILGKMILQDLFSFFGFRILT